MNIAKNVFFILILWALYSCTQAPDKNNEKTASPKVPPTLMQSELERLKDLSEKPGYENIQSIKALDLFSYISGYYQSGHSFPCIFYDPQNRTFTVTHSEFQQVYKEKELDNAIETFVTVLINSGYEINGKSTDNNKYIWIDGKKMVYVPISDLFPDDKAVKSHFTQSQYDFICSTDGWLMFSYLSGIKSDTYRDYPLMVALGYKETSCIWVLGKGMAEEFKTNDTTSAFKLYREYINKRLKSLK